MGRATNHVPLIRCLVGAVATGCAAGLTGGLVMAHVDRELHSLLSAEQGLARFMFLLVCMQIGAAVAIAIAMLPDDRR